MRGAKYTIIFATALSVVISLALSGIYMLLKDRQDLNRSLDQQMSILKAAKIDFTSKAEAAALFSERVIPYVIDLNGNVLTNISYEDVDEKAGDKLVLFGVKNSASDDDLKAYVYPVVGSGLWSKLYGYLAVDPLGKKVMGLTFYKQGETPGLGAEIEREWFVKNFSGKDLFRDGKLIGVRVAKGSSKIDPNYKVDKNHLVDGISGATITGDGVSDMMKKIPMLYEPWFANLRNN